MSGFAAAAVALLALGTPDGTLIARQLTSADDRPALPLQTLQSTAARLDLEGQGASVTAFAGYRGRPYGRSWVLQSSDAAAPSTAEPGGRSPFGPTSDDEIEGREQAEGRSGPAALGQRQRGRPALLLELEHFQVPADPAAPAHGARDFSPRHRWPLDVAEYLFHSLVEAWLEEQRRAASDFHGLARQRAAILMAAAPTEVQLSAYLRAVADYSSQLLAVAHEIERTRRRWQQQGRDPCDLLKPEIPLMRLWQRLSGMAQFRGRYLRGKPVESTAATVAPGGEAAAAEWAWQWVGTTGALQAVDKELINRFLFDGRWTGDPMLDFADLCPSGGAMDEGEEP